MPSIGIYKLNILQRSVYSTWSLSLISYCQHNNVTVKANLGFFGITIFNISISNICDNRSACLAMCVHFTFGLNLFILHWLWTNYINWAKSLSMTASCVNKSTSTRAHCVVCERHEVESRRRRDSNPRLSDALSNISHKK